MANVNPNSWNIYSYNPVKNDHVSFTGNAIKNLAGSNSSKIDLNDGLQRGEFLQYCDPANAKNQDEKTLFALLENKDIWNHFAGKDGTISRKEIEAFNKTFWNVSLGSVFAKNGYQTPQECVTIAYHNGIIPQANVSSGSTLEIMIRAAKGELER